MKRWRWGSNLALVVGLLLPALVARADDDVRAKIKAAGDAEKWKADAVVVLEATDVRVRPSGIGTARTQRVVKVLRDGGIRSQAVQSFPFDPHTNRLDLIAVRVYRVSGDVEEIPVDTRVQQPQTAWGIYWGAQQYVVSLPRLAVGDAVETISDMTGFNVAYLGAAGDTPEEGAGELNALGQPLQPPVPGHWHDEMHFWSGIPILEKRYTVRVPKDKPLQFEVYGGELRTAVLLDGDEQVYTFEKKNIEPFQNEPGMEATPNVATKLLLATLPTWQDKGRWLHGVSEGQFAWDDAIAKTVAEVVRNCQTDEEKYTALNHWVAENIRYAGTSRGMCEGYTVHRSVETFHDRCGVCKDKAGMLVTMLRAAGFESYLVMTMARQRVDRVPADQFNHAVTCLRKPDGTLVLLDPTWMPKSRDNWSTLEPLQHVVYGLPEGKELSQSPEFPPDTNQATWRAQSELDTNGRLSGSFSFTATGAPEGRLRRALATLHPADRQQLFDETILRLSPNARLGVTRCVDPVDFSQPVAVQGEYEADQFALGAGSRRYLALPMLQTVLGDRTLFDLFDKTSPEKRKYAIRLLATRWARFEETLRLPTEWKVVDKPQPVKIDGPSAALHFDLESTPGEIKYTCELVIKRWQIPPEEYANFKDVMTKFEELGGRIVTCELEGSHAQR